MSRREDHRVSYAGEHLAVYLYRPDTTGGDVPCVVMAHGFTGTREDGLAAYAEAFAEAGYAVALFDYRNFGASTGEPRQVLDIPAQHADYRAVVQWARTRDGVDPARIVLWGSSFSGGHVLAVAADDPSIAAVVSQAPHTDAFATLGQKPPGDTARILVDGLRDQIGAWLGRPPRMLPAVGPPGTLAAMTTPDAQPGFEAIVGPDSLWRNEFATRLMVRGFALYRPGTKTARITAPLLVCICDADTVTPPEPAAKAVARAPRGEARHYPYGHFDIYRDPAARTDQLEFLRRVVGR